MKSLRYIIFIPVISMLTILIYNIMQSLLMRILSLEEIQLILFMVFYGGVTIAGFHFLPGIVSWLISKISPSINFAFYTTFTVVTIITFVYIVGYWLTGPGILGVGLTNYISLTLSLLTLGISSSIIAGAGANVLEEKQDKLVNIVLIGAIVFYIGIFLVLCLFSISLTNINPEKTYSWYHGIWHGIFIIPNWIVSLFSEHVFVKAPKSTTAYSVFWWIILAWTLWTMFGGGWKRLFI